VRRSALLLALALLAVASCDRNLEPFDPDEQPREPDLSKIFPEGADRAQPIEPALPSAPGESRGAPPMPSEVADSGAGAEAEPISGTVELSPELADAAPSGAFLFVIARRGGGGPPLAVKRIPDPTFPFSFTLGPADRMIQQMPFEGPITLSARLDSDGDAISRAPGDLMGAATGGPVAPGATGIRIVLDTVM